MIGTEASVVMFINSLDLRVLYRPMTLLTITLMVMQMPTRFVASLCFINNMFTRLIAHLFYFYVLVII